MSLIPTKETLVKTYVESTCSIVNWEIENFSLLAPMHASAWPAKVKEDQLARVIRTPEQTMSLGKSLDPSNTNIGVEFTWSTALSFKEDVAGGTSQPGDEIAVALNLNYKLSASAQPIDVNFRASIIGEGDAVLKQSVFTFLTSSIGANFSYGWQSFVRLNVIAKNLTKYLVKDILHIRLAVTIFHPGFSKPVSVRPSHPALSCQSLAGHLAQDMRSLLESGLGSDITISCGEQTFKAHSQILKARSPVFRAMLEAGMSESVSGKIDIEDVEPLKFKQFLEYMYTSSVPEFTQDVDSIALQIGLMELADKYEVLVLKSHCFEQMLEHISLATAGEITVKAHAHSAPQGIRTKAMEFCLANWKALSHEATFQKYVSEFPAAFLQIG